MYTAEANTTEDDDNFQVYADILKSCMERECNIKLLVRVGNQCRALVHALSTCSHWTNIDYSFLGKNWDHVYWTNWIETTNCETSSHIKFKRLCVDCDSDSLEQIYCNAGGPTVMEQECNHYWGEWNEGSCVTSACNGAGDRVTARQCLYGNGSEASDSVLCLKGNKTATKMETYATLELKCNIQNSFDYSQNSGVYIALGTGIFLLLFQALVIAFLLKKLRAFSTKFQNTVDSSKIVTIEHHVYNQVQESIEYMRPEKIASKPQYVNLGIKTSKLNQELHQNQSTASNHSNHIEQRIDSSGYVTFEDTSSLDGYEFRWCLNRQNNCCDLI